MGLHVRVPAAEPVLGQRVLGISFGSRSKQMFRPNASGVIAFMANKKTVRNWRIGNTERISMCANAGLVVRSKSPIPITV